jgi:hypothetical protein
MAPQWPMPVGEDDAIHASDVESETLDIALEDPGVRPGVEQERARGVAAAGGDGAGKTMRPATQAMSRQPSQPLLP